MSARGSNADVNAFGELVSLSGTELYLSTKPKNCSSISCSPQASDGGESRQIPFFLGQRSIFQILFFHNNGGSEHIFQ